MAGRTEDMLARLRILLANASVLAATRFVGAGVGFLAQVILAKALGAHDLGIFYAATSLSAVAGIAAAQGYPEIAARFAARYRNKDEPGLFAAFAGQATCDALAIGSLLALMVTAWAIFWPSLADDTRLAYVLGGWMIIAVAITNIYVNIAGGMRHFGLCYVPEGLVRPVVFFAVIAATAALGLQLVAVRAVAISAAVIAMVAIGVFMAVRVRMPPIRWTRVRHGKLVWRWRREAWLLVLLAVFTNFFADIGILVVVPFLPSAEVAVFGLCLKLALLVGYFVQVAQQIAVPDIADARHAGDGAAIRRAAWRSIAMPVLLTLGSLACVGLFGRELLAIFGPQFAEGQGVLFILVVAQVLRALAGPSSHLMTLRGVQGLNAALSAGAIGLLLVSSGVLTRFYGIHGAALAVLLTYACWLLATAIALNRLGETRTDFMASMPAFGKATY